MNKLSHINFSDLQTTDGQALKALMRVDFNVPLDEERKVTDTTRIKAALPSIQKLLANGTALILMSHLGRPKGEANPKYSLKHVVGSLQELLPDVTIYFSENCIGEKTQQMAHQLKSGELLLLENTRFHKGEKAGDTDFAQALADLEAHIYVNDAFGTAHRAHASTYTVAQLFPESHRFIGLLMAKEIENADKVLNNAERPLTAILGGAKVSDKLLLIESLLDKVNNLLIGGGMAYTFFKASGGNIGNSLVEMEQLELAKRLIKTCEEKQVHLCLPVDSVIADRFDNEAERKTSPSGEIPDAWMGLDIGEQARKEFSDIIANSKTIFWNGPMGVFEFANFAEGTKTVAQAVAAATKEKGAFTLIGGGDSVAAINSLGLQNEVSYVSTGGGAMLKFMEGNSLPALKALV